MSKKPAIKKVDAMQKAWTKYVNQCGGRPPLTCILASGNKADEMLYILEASK